METDFSNVTDVQTAVPRHTGGRLSRFFFKRRLFVVKGRSLFTVVIVKENIEVIVYEGSGHALEDPPGRGNDKIRLKALVAMRDLFKTGVSGP